jgi:membrane associated rhomboid family serine protease
MSAYDVFLLQWGYKPASPSILTLLTSMFLHGGWLHLLGNMLFLWIYGDNVEHRLGRLGYLWGYLLTGIVAAAGYGLVAPKSAGLVPMVGASGAISGVLGLYFIWFPRNKVRLLVFLFPFFFVWKIGARIVLGFYLFAENLLPFLFSGEGSGGGVAYGAHIGGFLAGLVGAYGLEKWVAFNCRRDARKCAGEPSGSRDFPSLPSSERVQKLFQAGDQEEAVKGYFSLDRADRRAIPVTTALEMAEWLAAQQQGDAALAVYRQILDDHPRGQNLGRIFLGIGLVLLHLKQRPTAAYQYLLDALDADPHPAVAAQARDALRLIEQMQKLPMQSRRLW